ncbi:MAG: amidohydrolase family protein [Bacteroidota bacterium]
MTKYNVLLIFSIILFISGKLSSQQTDNRYLIYNAQIIDVFSGKIIKEKAVLIDNQKIVAIGSFQKLKKSVAASHQINANNHFMIPGLWDMHIHLEEPKLIEETKALLPLFFAYGITTVRDCASDLGEQVLGWRNQINAGKLLGPTIFTAGIKLEGVNSLWKGDYEIANETELNTALNKLDKFKVDFVKITENTLKGPLFLKSIEAAHKRGYLVSGHVPIDLTLNEMVDEGFSSVEHSSYLLRQGSAENDIVSDVKSGKITTAQANSLYQTTFNQSLAIKNYQILGKKGLFVTPTLIGGKQLAYLDESDYPKDSMMANLLTKAYTSNYAWRIERQAKDTPEQKADRKRRYLLNQSQIPHIQKAGITILAGSDCAPLNSFVYPGQSLIQELLLFKNAGLTPLQILQSATINGAKFLKKTSTMGSIDKGKIADIVLLKNNPLIDISALEKINAVFTKGQYFDRKALDRIVQDIKALKIKLDSERGK